MADLYDCHGEDLVTKDVEDAVATDANTVRIACTS